MLLSKRWRAMRLYQPSLWDNVALENGYMLFSVLNLKEAIVQFNEALLSPIADQESTQAAVDACVYWQKMLGSALELPANGSPSEHDNQFVSEVLEAYMEYPFDSRMTGFKKKLLENLVHIFQHKCTLDLNTFETIFDLLLDLKMYPNSKNLASHYVQQLPKKYSLLYFLAQAQWLNKNTTEACCNNARALLYFPDRKLKNRIVHGQLEQFVDAHGMEMAPVFGQLYEILPEVLLNDGIQPLNKLHQNAIRSYLLLHKLVKTENIDNHKAQIQYRRQLKKQAPILFEAFMRRLKQRE